MVQNNTPQFNTDTRPDRLLLAAVLGETAGFTDLQRLWAMLNEPSDTQRAETILDRVGNLHLLVPSGPLELQALGLSDGEIARLLVQLELCARVDSSITTIHRHRNRLAESEGMRELSSLLGICLWGSQESFQID